MPFSEQTQINANGFPTYRRRNNGRTVARQNRNGQIFQLDNSWVVPYNKFLLKKYRSHINIEICLGLNSVKYLYKYIYKGHDRANVEIQQQYEHDEIRQYVDARYVAPVEAAYRLYKLPLMGFSHSITRLPVHLPNFQNVFFRDGEHEQALQRAQNNPSKLKDFFRLNREDPTARAFLYTDIVHLYKWDDRQHCWVRRQRRLFGPIARMYSVSPREGEKFFIRVLLNHVRGPQSFQDLRTVNGHVYDTFQEACVAMGLVADDNIWVQTLQDAAQYRMPKGLRSTFSYILLFGEVGQPRELWNRFQHQLTEDFLRRNFNQEAANTAALRHIASILRHQGRTLEHFGLPNIEVQLLQNHVDVDAAREALREMQGPLNADQQAFADVVLESLRQYLDGAHNIPRCFYLDGPAGTGKTYTYNYIINSANALGHSVATSAFTGCAANLLRHGKTSHSLFKLPFILNEDSVCGIQRNDAEAEELLRQTIFITDEAPMQPRYALEAIDRLLQFLTGNNVPFGGKIIILGGDKRQTLPIVPRNINMSVVQYSLFSSELWQHFRVFQLYHNNRVLPDQQQFADFLLQVGDNLLPVREDPPFQGNVCIPQQCVVRNNIIPAVFPRGRVAEWDNNVILSPTNDVSLRINSQILRNLPGPLVQCFSIDTLEVDDIADGQDVPVEYLNTLTPSGLPPHNLQLKEGCIIILLRNLDTNAGLSNGTRLKVNRIDQHIIQATILSGMNAGNRAFIPKLPLRPADNNAHIALKRIQFPVRLAYALTINKSQGQTFNKVGIYLERPCFAHGQLYVAFSRARSFNDVKVFVEQSDLQGHHNDQAYTKNVVEANIP